MTSDMLLFTPGPTTIPERVITAMSQCASVHHRTSEFEKIFATCQESFANLFALPEPPLFLASSGTGGLEAALRNICEPGETVAFVNGGKFGERWGKIAAALGFSPLELSCEWGESISKEELTNTLRNAETPIRAICFQHLETSTGVLHPVEEFSEIVRQESPETFILIDAISSFACSPLDVRCADIVIAGSQKALMLPPGLCFLMLSERAWQRAEECDSGSFYFNLLAERKAQKRSNSAWTPPISLILGLHEVLKMLAEEGMPEVFHRQDQNAKVCRAGLVELGFTTLSDDYPAAGVTPARPPKNVDASKLPALLVDSCGKRIAGAQDQWKGKVVRIGHMGSITPQDVQELLKDLSCAIV